MQKSPNIENLKPRMRYLKYHPNFKVKYIQGINMRITEIKVVIEAMK